MKLDAVRSLALIGVSGWALFFAIQLITVFNEIQATKQWWWFLDAKGLLTVDRRIAIGQWLTAQDFLFLMLVILLVGSVYVLVKIWYGGKKDEKK